MKRCRGVGLGERLCVQEPSGYSRAHKVEHTGQYKSILPRAQGRMYMGSQESATTEAWACRRNHVGKAVFTRSKWLYWKHDRQKSVLRWNMTLLDKLELVESATYQNDKALLAKR